MRKIKDFFYDYNDVFVALLIIAVAGFIIFWRVNAVMSYADVAEIKEVQQIDIDFSNIDLGKENVDEMKDPEPEQDPQQDPQQEPEQDPQQEPEQQPEQEPEKEPEQQPEKQPEKTETKKYTIEISKAAGTTNWTAVGKVLQEKGIISDYKEFVARVITREVESRLQFGSFDVDSTMTLDQVIDILIKK